METNIKKIKRADKDITQVWITYGTFRKLKSIVLDDPRVDIDMNDDDTSDFDSLINEVLVFMKYKHDHELMELKGKKSD